MTRLTITTLIILGLMFQPFGSVVSAKRIDGDMDHSVMSMDMGEPMMTMDEDAGQMPCHENVQGKNGDSCDECCDTGCSMMNQCVTSFTTVALAQSTRYLWSERSASFFTPYSLTYKDRHLALIYYPPRVS